MKLLLVAYSLQSIASTILWKPQTSPEASCLLVPADVIFEFPNFFHLAGPDKHVARFGNFLWQLGYPSFPS